LYFLEQGENTYDMKDGWLSNVDLNELEHSNEYTFGVVCAQWNSEITHILFEECTKTLADLGAKDEKIHTAFVPGTFELPSAAKFMLSYRDCDAVVALGCVIKGETEHDRFINEAVSSGLMQLGLMSNVPCLFGVLTTSNYQQALDRANGTVENKGRDCAFSATYMARLKGDLKNETKGQIGFL
jgi:6,7-dimethyl-8-ribityllumazine synthase